MKANFLFILLSVLFLIPANATNSEKRKHNPHYRERDKKEHVCTRSPLYFDINVQEADDCLQIIFLGSLPDAEIIVTDKEGNTIINESQSPIYEGKILYIYSADTYPYTVIITSPVLDLTGEIMQE